MASDMSNQASNENLALLRRLAADWGPTDSTGKVTAWAADEIQRLTAALVTCQTYDYRTLADEVSRLDTAVHETCLSLDTMTAERDRLRAGLRYAWQTEGGVRKEDDALYDELTLETGLKP